MRKYAHLLLVLALGACGDEDPAETYAVAITGSHVTLGIDSPQRVTEGATVSLSVIAESGYALDNVVSGSCPTGTWSGSTYTTGAIIADCSLGFSATLRQAPAVSRTVTFSGTNVSFSIGSPQTLFDGATLSVPVIAADGFTLDSEVGGTCPAGVWNGSTYTTGSVTADCSLTFSATRDPEPTVYSVSFSGTNVTFTTMSPQTVRNGETVSVTVNVPTGHTLSNQVGGTCPTGAWISRTYTTGPVVADCSLVFMATRNTYTVVGSAEANGSISPSGVQSVTHGGNLTFTAVPNQGYQVNGWTVDGVSYPACGTNATCQLTNITANRSISVLFAAD